jgi:hypothetical protein
MARRTGAASLLRGRQRLRALSHPRLVSGTSRDGVWEIAGTLPKFAAAGTWRPLVIFANDGVGPKTSIIRGADGVFRTNDGSTVDVSLAPTTVRDSHLVGGARNR